MMIKSFTQRLTSPGIAKCRGLGGKTIIMENCSKINEALPIPVKVDKSWTGGYLVIEVAPMLMKYETWQTLKENMTDEELDYAVTIGRTVTAKDREQANSVSGGSYDYANGKCAFYAHTQKCINNWLLKFNHIVKLDK